MWRAYNRESQNARNGRKENQFDLKYKNTTINYKTTTSRYNTRDHITNWDPNKPQPLLTTISEPVRTSLGAKFGSRYRYRRDTIRDRGLRNFNRKRSHNLSIIHDKEYAAEQTSYLYRINSFFKTDSEASIYEKPQNRRTRSAADFTLDGDVSKLNLRRKSFIPGAEG